MEIRGKFDRHISAYDPTSTSAKRSVGEEVEGNYKLKSCIPFTKKETPVLF